MLPDFCPQSSSYYQQQQETSDSQEAHVVFAQSPDTCLGTFAKTWQSLKQQHY